MLAVLTVSIGLIIFLLVAVENGRNFLSIAGIVNITFFLGFIVRPLLIIFYFDGVTYNGLNVADDMQSFVGILLLAYFLYLFFYFGLLGGRNKISHLNSFSLDRNQILAISKLLMITGILGYLSYLYVAGFFDSGITGLFEYIYGDRGFYYFRSVSFLFIFGFFGILKYGNLGWVAKLLYLVIALAITLSFYARQHFVIFAVLGLHLYLMGFDPKRAAKFDLKGIMVLIFVFISLSSSMSFSLNARSVFAAGDEINLVEIGGEQQAPLEYLLNSGQITYFDFGVEIYQDKGFELNHIGRSFLNLMMTPIPSSLYKDKPKNFNRALAEDSTRKYPSSPAFGYSVEIFYNLSILSFLVGPLLMFSIGYWMRKAFNSLNIDGFNYMFYIFIFSSFFLCLRSGLAPSMASFFEKAVPFLVIVFFYKLVLFRGVIR